MFLQVEYPVNAVNEVYFGILHWYCGFIIITDYLQPASYWLVYTYCHDIDIHKFLLFLNYW